MWRWPWVGRGRLDDALAQITWLRAQLAALTDQAIRIERQRVGLPEVPRGAREEIGVMPRDLLDYCNGFDNPSIGRQIRNTCFRRRSQGESWETIAVEVLSDGETDDE